MTNGSRSVLRVRARDAFVAAVLSLLLALGAATAGIVGSLRVNRNKREQGESFALVCTSTSGGSDTELAQLRLATIYAWLSVAVNAVATVWSALVLGRCIEPSNADAVAVFWPFAASFFLTMWIGIAAAGVVQCWQPELTAMVVVAAVLAIVLFVFAVVLLKRQPPRRYTSL